MSTERGTVKWFNDAKGFGFINHKSGKDVFVHYSVIQTEGFKTLKDGELVDYELTEGPKGLNASKVFRLVQQNAAAPAEASETQAASLSQQIEVVRNNDQGETVVTEIRESTLITIENQEEAPEELSH